MLEKMLRVENLRTRFRTRAGEVLAVDDVSFDLARGETVAVVGESGCGKSVTALSILRLLDESVGRVVGGRILFEGSDLATKSTKEMREIRGNKISMIFQEPMTSLNPLLTIGWQISETLRRHTSVSATAARERVVELLTDVRIPEPEHRIHQYPHQLSGGMRQRVMIAMALACRPRLLIADEPTTALDVTIQAQILELMRDLKDRMGTAILLITHDLGVVAETASRVIVMYAGRKVEEATVEDLFARPGHPYTVGLLGSVPRLGLSSRSEGRTRLSEIPGMVPAIRSSAPQCHFADRCRLASEICRREVPPLLAARGKDHSVACFHADRIGELA